MMLQNLLPQSLGAHMSVYFGRSDALMSEHCLYGTQVGTAFKQ